MLCNVFAIAVPYMLRVTRILWCRYFLDPLITFSTENLDCVICFNCREDIVRNDVMLDFIYVTSWIPVYCKVADGRNFKRSEVG